MALRFKTVTFDGQSYRIRSLSLAEATKFADDLQGAVKDDAPDKDKLAALWRGFVCMSLAPEDEKDKWTGYRVMSELDIPTFQFLREEAQKFSGLGGGEKEPGEATSSQT